MKWLRAIGLTAAFGSVFTAGVYAQDIVQKVDAYLRPDFNIVLDGKPVNLAHSTLIYDDSSYLPLKEIGTLFGATINWDGSTKTIYVNSRINPEQPETADDVQYEQVPMMSAYGTVLEYLGAKYNVLKMYAGTQQYYRLSDVRAMGVDTDGLTKVRETYTGWLFISEAELKKRWRQTPKQTYDATAQVPFMTSETDPDKLKTMNDYVKTWGHYQVNNQFHNVVPIVLDPLPQPNEYRMLATDNGHFYFLNLKLTEVTEGHYVVNTFSTVDLEAGKKENTNPWQ
jgi:hypothetical protein